MRLFIAEKQIQGKAIADALSEKQVEKAGYILCGEADIVTWASGHLYEQAEPEFYDAKYKSWKAEDLPIIPEPGKWAILPVPGKEKQIDMMHALMAKADTIVNACDFDREGQRIGDEIVEHAPALKTDAEILRLNSSGGLSKSELQDALARMRPNKEFEALSKSAMARAQADWIVGMNMSRAYTLAGRDSGYKKTEILSVGRVQTPTLGLVVKRDRAIDRFLPTTYFVTAALIEHARGDIVAAWKPAEGTEGLDDDGRVVRREIAERMAKEVKGRTGVVSSYKEQEVPERPPLPHSLTTLQIQANERNGLTAGQVLAAAQALYERYKVVSYPRSDCRFLPEGQHADAISVLHAIAKNDPEKSIVCDNADPDLKSEAWNDERLKSHHGIIPLATIADLSSLSRDEQVVYDLICRAYIAQFYEDARYREVSIGFAVARESFEAKRRDVAFPGWRLLYPAKSEKIREKPPLPAVETGDRVRCSEIEISEKKTSPPARFTDASLIAAMNNIEKHVDDEDIKKRLSASSGIGTEATRSEIIETIIKREFVHREGRQIVSTRLGRDLIEALPKEMTEPGLTAIYDQILERIAAGEFRMEVFIERQAEVIREMVATASVKPRQFMLRDDDETDEDGDDGFIAHRPKKNRRQRDAISAA